MKWKIKRHGRTIIKDTTTHITLTILVFCLNLPFFSMLGTAMKGRTKALSTISLFPKPNEIDFSAFQSVLFHTNFPINIRNSLIVAFTVMLSCIVIASMAGYAISRFRGKFFNGYSTMLLLLQIFPGVLLLLPLFIMFTNLRLANTLYCLMLSYTTMNLAFSTWMMRGFFDSIPKELEEAGMVDGCTRFQAFYRVVLPLSLPGVSTIAIFTFINAWNEYMIASILVKKNDLQTMTLGLQKFVQQFTSDWSTLMAASSIAIVPTLIGLIIAQKYLIEGMTAGAVKG
jgi:ABC-type glycerol-3-phosphate transport system permease component